MKGGYPAPAGALESAILVADDAPKKEQRGAGELQLPADEAPGLGRLAFVADMDQLLRKTAPAASWK